VVRKVQRKKKWKKKTEREQRVGPVEEIRVERAEELPPKAPSREV
jgi:hypothetical protein